MTLTEFKGKIKKKAGLGLAVASLFFLFNPDVAIVDVLPDVFGYILLVAGLENLASVCDKINDARELFKKAAICGAVKLALLIVTFGLVTPKELPVSLLLFTFVMGIFDLIFLVPAYTKLFDGLVYLGERLNGTYLLSRKGKGKSKAEKLRTFTLFFVIFKVVAPVLPEFTSLLNYEYNNSLVNYYDFIGLYRITEIALVLVPGIVWLCMSVAFYRGIISDKTFMNEVKRKYDEEVSPNKEYFMRKYVRNMSALATVALAFTVNLYFDGYNIIPSVLSAVLFFVLAQRTGKYSGARIFMTVSSVLYALSSLAHEAMRIKFKTEFIPEQVMRNPDAYSSWQRVIFFSVIESVCFLLVTASLFVSVRNIAKKYTGYFSRGYDSFDPREASRELHSELLRPLIPTAAIAVFSAALPAAYTVGLAYNVGFIWLLELAFSLLFVFRAAHNIHDVAGQINYGHFARSE